LIIYLVVIVDGGSNGDEACVGATVGVLPCGTYT
jgi:hypothetical protein